jgi:hypothetical protein
MVKKHDDPNRRKHLHHESSDVVLHEKAKKEHHAKRGTSGGWNLVRRLMLSTKHYQGYYCLLNCAPFRRMISSSDLLLVDHLNISVREHMSSVDCVDGSNMRRHGEQNTEEKTASQDIDTDDLLVIHPVVDGRLKDVARG